MLIHFQRCIQDSQELGSTVEHMISRVDFTLEDSGQRVPGYAVVKQIVGGRYDRDPLEVTGPIGYDGSVNHMKWQQAVESYYRGLVGSTGHLISVAPGAHVRMSNNILEMEKTVDIGDVRSGGTEGGW